MIKYSVRAQVYIIRTKRSSESAQQIIYRSGYTVKPSRFYCSVLRYVDLQSMLFIFLLVKTDARDLVVRQNDKRRVLIAIITLCNSFNYAHIIHVVTV